MKDKNMVVLLKESVAVIGKTCSKVFLTNGKISVAGYVARIIVLA